MASVVPVLKVVTSAMTASFRYPHIMVGRLPTFEMPPPATIYGHLCGVLGEWFPPEKVKFAYTFTHRGIGEDLELAHVLEYTSTEKKRKQGVPGNVAGSINPQRRQFLLKPQMTLYIKGPQEFLEKLRAAFYRPAFAYILGRSQDLAICHSAEWGELTVAKSAFFSHTILPWSLRPWVLRGEPVLMPQFLDYYKLREPTFCRYLQIRNRPVRILGEGDEPDITSREPFLNLLVDPAEKKMIGEHYFCRGVWFHSFKGGESS